MHERETRLVSQQMKLDRIAAQAGALDVADLIDPHRLGEHAACRAEPLPNLERARQRGAGLGLGRETGIGFEHDEGNIVVGKRQRGREPNWAGSDDATGRSVINGNAPRPIVTRQAGHISFATILALALGMLADWCSRLASTTIFPIHPALIAKNHRTRNFDTNRASTGYVSGIQDYNVRSTGRA